MVAGNTAARQQVKPKEAGGAIAPEGEEAGPRTQRAQSRAPSATRTCKTSPRSLWWTIKVDSRYGGEEGRASPIAAEETSEAVLLAQVSVVEAVQLAEPGVDLRAIEDAAVRLSGEAGETGRGYVSVDHF